MATKMNDAKREQTNKLTSAKTPPRFVDQPRKGRRDISAEAPHPSHPGGNVYSKMIGAHQQTHRAKRNLSRTDRRQNG